MTDTSNDIDGVDRQVRDSVIDTGPARTVVISRSYKSSIEDVWDACTNPERVARWFLPVSGELRVGGRYHMQISEGTIERCEPPSGFAATWEYAGNVSWIELRLTAEGEGSTRLELEHIAPDDQDRWNEFGPGAVGVGWDMALMGLGRHIESPAAPRPDAAAWGASEEGRRVISSSSERWCEASIAAGTEPDAARAAAARTTAFYLGSSE